MGALSVIISLLAKSKTGLNLTNKTVIVTTGLLLIAGTSGIAISTPSVAANPEAVKWTRVSIPTEGQAGNWVLAANSDVQHLTAASDGTLYAYGKGLTYTLYRSTDNGISWSRIGNVQDSITGITVSPFEPETVYYATVSSVYRSADRGSTFSPLTVNPEFAGSGNREITSIDVTWVNGNIITIGTRDTDGSEFGGVYTLNEADIIPSWTDTSIGNYDVYAVAFSPNYHADRQLVAVITDETDTFVTTRIGDTGWGTTTANARLNRDNSGTPLPVVVSSPAAIAFPGNYDADVASGCSVYYVSIDTGAGEGDVYRINCAEVPGTSSATDLNMVLAYGQNNIDVTSLAASGDYPTVTLLAGIADSAGTYLSLDGGASWKASREQPSGQSQTYVLMAPDFALTGSMYAATSGNGSAFSITRDLGDTWNQLSLIDTTVSAIANLAPSPDYSQDNSLFMITFGGGHSLWRSLDDGNTWERILANSLVGVDNFSLVALPPQYSDDCRTVFVAGESNGQPSIWESTDNGQSFRRRFTRDPETGNAFSIKTWTVVDETTLIIGTFNGSNGMVYRTTNSGFFFAPGAAAGSQSLKSIALSPDYEQDGTIIVGNNNGWIYWSDDNGSSFQPLPIDAISPPLTGAITVAFDPAFNSNNTVYAASDTADSGIHRFVIGSSNEWQSIDTNLSGGATLNQLRAGGSGTLYAANSDGDGGMERSLNPTHSTGPTFETVTRGLSDGATLSGLWLSGHRLWSVDTTNIRLMYYNDTLTSPVVQVLPVNGASGIGGLIDHTVRNVSLDWETLDGATSYRWQCHYDASFTSVPGGFEDTTSASSTHLPALEPATTYYWRVRASAPVLGPWSEKWSFTTSLDTEAIAMKPEHPPVGATGVPVRPVFQWTAVAGADSYELLVATDAGFDSPAIVRTEEYALPTNAWQCDISLDYDTVYYWKVRATSTSTLSPWSAAGVFTTEAEPSVFDEVTAGPVAPAPTVTPSTTIVPLPETSSPLQLYPPTPPSPSSQADAPVPAVSQLPAIQNWVIYLLGGLLFTLILALTVMLVMVLKMRRL